MSGEHRAVTQYVLDPLAPFPRRWRDARGPITVMCDPVKGYVMARRPGCAPFVLSVAELLNAKRHPTLGPFELASPAGRLALHSSKTEETGGSDG